MGRRGGRGGVLPASSSLVSGAEAAELPGVCRWRHLPGSETLRFVATTGRGWLFPVVCAPGGMGERRWSGGEGVYLESTPVSLPSPPTPLLGFSDARLPGSPTGSSGREWICGGPGCCHSLGGGAGEAGCERKGFRRKWATQPGGNPARRRGHYNNNIRNNTSNSRYLLCAHSTRGHYAVCVSLVQKVSVKGPCQQRRAALWMTPPPWAWPPRGK